MKYKFSDIPTKYKVGDMIVVTHDFSFDGKHFKKGDIGKIDAYDTNVICAYDIGWYDIVWSEDIGGHDLNGRCRQGHGWTIDSNVVSINTCLVNHS